MSEFWLGIGIAAVGLAIVALMRRQAKAERRKERLRPGASHDN